MTKRIDLADSPTAHNNGAWLELARMYESKRDWMSAAVAWRKGRIATAGHKRRQFFIDRRAECLRLMEREDA